MAFKPGRGRLRKDIVNEIVINGVLIKRGRAASPPLCQRRHCGGGGGARKGDKDTGGGGGTRLQCHGSGSRAPRGRGPFSSGGEGLPEVPSPRGAGGGGRRRGRRSGKGPEDAAPLRLRPLPAHSAAAGLRRPRPPSLLIGHAPSLPVDHAPFSRLATPPSSPPPGVAGPPGGAELQVGASVCPSVHPYGRPSVHPSVPMGVHLPACPSVPMVVHMSVRPSARPSLWASTCLSVHPCGCPSVHPSLWTSVCPFTRLSICLSTQP